ncbi:hypothetical protein E8E14_007399 [Neopestalotiopsis sp. 37M]|nr:hypothetical protein E8E14_007399 [Neopestalotiopsis sp. 37M]
MSRLQRVEAEQAASPTSTRKIFKLKSTSVCSRKILSMSIVNTKPVEPRTMLGRNATADHSRTSMQFDGSGIQAHNSNIHVARDVIINGIAPAELRDEVDTHRREVLHSLRFQQMGDRQQTVKRAHPKTCQWFLETSEYKSWLNMDKHQEFGEFLWLKGNPGSGKSTLMKLALDRTEQALKSTNTCILVFFFNSRGVDLEKTTAGLYRALLVQLLNAHPEVRHVLDSLRVADHWGDELLRGAFEQALITLKQQRFVCFIDALDECGEREVREMISWLDALSCEYPIHVCFASRHYPHIAIRKGLKLVLENEEGHSHDISYYLRDNLYFEDDNALAEQIRADLRNKASGIFIWVVLVVDILNREYDAGQKHTLREKIKNIPADLHELFRDILTRAPGPSYGLLLCLQWILFAQKPLTPMQLYFAILSGSEPQNLLKCHSTEISENDAKRFILNNSRGFAETTKSTNSTVQFIHGSVKDFLLKENGFGTIWNELEVNPEGLGHDALTQCCLRYQTAVGSVFEQDLLPKTVPEANKIYAVLMQKYPFLEYANHGLLFHANQAERYHITQNVFLRQFPLELWRQLHNIFVRRAARWYTAQVSLLYVLTDQNYPALIRASSLRSCFDIEDGRYGAPVFMALAIQNYSVLESLLQTFFDGQTKPHFRNRDPMEFVQQDHEKIDQSMLVKDFIFSKSRSVACHLAMLGCYGLLEIYLTFQESATDQKDGDGRTPLFYAAENGHAAAITLLIERGANIDSNIANGEWTPLRLALSKGHIEATRRLINGGADPNATKDQTWSPLLMAVSKGLTEIAKLLLDRGADTEFTDSIRRCSNGRDPLHYAATFVDAGVLKKLIDRGAKLDTCDDSGETPLDKAFNFGRQENVEHLLHHSNYMVPQEDIDNRRVDKAIHFNWQRIINLMFDVGAVVRFARDSAGKIYLHRTISLGLEEVVEHLIDRGADIHGRDSSGRTPLHEAIRSGKQEIAKSLIDHGADVRICDSFGQTPLHVADRQESAKLLIDHGADVCACDSSGRTPLHNAYQHGIAKLLIDHGADIHALDNSNRTPLYEAVQLGKQEIVQLLIDHGAHVICNSSGRTLLHEAIISQNYKDAKLLVDHGVDVCTRDNFGRTPLHDSREYRLAKLLIDHGADVNARDASGRTRLHDAREYGIAELLLGHGADVCIPDDSGRTPLHEARELRLVKLLLDHGADVNARDNSGRTPLHEARKTGVTKVLHNHVANDFGAYDKSGQVPLQVAFLQALRQQDQEAVKALVDRGVNIDSRDDAGQTPLQQAVYERNGKALKILIDCGADVDVRDESGRAPLHIAMCIRNREMIDLLIDGGADINARDDAGWLWSFSG